MFARVARFEGADLSRIDDVVQQTRSDVESGSPPEGLEGAREVLFLIDRNTGSGLGITFFDDEEGLRRGDEALNNMSPPAQGGRRTSVEKYEVAFRHTTS